MGGQRGGQRERSKEGPKWEVKGGGQRWGQNRRSKGRPKEGLKWRSKEEAKGEVKG